MDIIKVVTELNEKHTALNEADKAYRECKDKIIGYVEDAVRMYCRKQLEVYKEIGISSYVYEDKIPYSEIDNFEVEKELEEYYIVLCDYKDRDDEIFHWRIKLPKDRSKLGTFVEEFGNEIIQQHEYKKKKKEEKHKELRRERYMELKKEFESE